MDKEKYDYRGLISTELVDEVYKTFILPEVALRDWAIQENDRVPGIIDYSDDDVWNEVYKQQDKFWIIYSGSKRYAGNRFKYGKAGKFLMIIKSIFMGKDIATLDSWRKFVQNALYGNFGCWLVFKSSPAIEEAYGLLHDLTGDQKWSGAAAAWHVVDAAQDAAIQISFAIREREE